MTTSETSTLPAFPFPFGPFGTSTLAYDEFRRTEPVRKVTVPSGAVVWLVTRYDDVAFVHKDRRMSREEALRAGISLEPDSPMELADGVLQNIDGERHANLRRLFASHYDRRHTGRWEQSIDLAARQVVAGLRSRESFDLRADFFEPVARRCAKELFGFPEPEGRRILELFFDPAVAERVHERLSSIVRDGTHASMGSHLSKLKAYVDEGEISEEDLIVNLLVFYTVTFEAAGGPFLGGLFAFMRDREQWQMLIDDGKLVTNAVEEMLRCYPNGDGQFLRVATEDIELSSVRIHRGDGVLAPAAAANADPEVFPEPRRFDITRANSNRNIAFGVGRHHCLGWHLAKVFMGRMLRVAVEELPDIELAVEPETIRYRSMPLISIMEALPVRQVGN